MKSRAVLVLTLVLLFVVPVVAGEKEDAFFDAARKGDLSAVKKLHKGGVGVDTRTRYGATALSYACDKGHLDVVRYLVENGADINNRDEFYKFGPIGWALFNEHTDIVVFLLENGSEDAVSALSGGVRQKNEAIVKAALKSPLVDSDDVAAVLEQAKQLEDAEAIVALLENAEVKQAEGRAEGVEVSPETMESYAGTYSNADIGMDIAVRVEEGELILQATGQGPVKMKPSSETSFVPKDLPQLQLEITFGGRAGVIENMTLQQAGQTLVFRPKESEVAKAAEAPDDSKKAGKPAPEVRKITRLPQQNWPSFRGVRASGVADGQGAPVEWDVASGKNVRWKTPIPGIANSSPIVWKDRVFVSTAVSSSGDDTFRIGLYGDVDSVDDESLHEFKMYALSRSTGEILWEKTATKKVPGTRRHLKSSQANSTPATDGKQVVALFGTVGLLVAWDFDGKELWRSDLGILDAGWFYDPSYAWGHASSPVIHDGMVIVQADVNENSFIAAYSLKNGKQVWKTERESIPSWGSPTVYDGKERDEIITNGNTIRGYDPKTGKELWHLAPNSEVTVATPVVAHDLFYITAGYPPVRPIYAIRPGGNGEISLPEGKEASNAVAWSKNRGGTYMPTPIVYGDYLYTCANDGRMRVYDALTGEEIYKERVGGGGSFTASPIASDGHLYFTKESGEIVVIKAGPVYKEVATNNMDEIIMSTPAISDGMVVVRTIDHVYGLGEPVTQSAK